MKKKIGISCIGSGVGQSVINSIRSAGRPYYTIGLGTNPMAFGAYECDDFDYTPNIYAVDYIDELLKKCVKHEIDLLIPGNDDEVLLFAKNSKKISSYGIKAIYSNEALVSLCRDKNRMSRDLNKVANIFVKSFELHEIYEALSAGELNFPLIAKPKGGYASKGIIIVNSKEDIASIPAGFVIQELALPSKTDPNYKLYIQQIEQKINPQVSEFSIQLVYDLNGNLLGKMASFNKLNNGVPVEIIPIDVPAVWEAVDKITPTLLALGLKGPLNLQGRLTDAGLKIFEMNPRFTGISGLRALMGFNEVVACAKVWLGEDQEKDSLKIVSGRFGIRQTADKSIALERNAEVAELSMILNKAEFKTKKTVLLTGATGYLGRQITQKILDAHDKFELVTLGRNSELSSALFGTENIRHCTYEDLRSGKFSISTADIVLHAAFARPHCTYQEIAQSMALTTELFTLAAMNQVPVIINISSQSVYGVQQPIPRKETTPAAPETAYGQAKYATEELLSSLSNIFPHLRQTSIRLAALDGGEAGYTEMGFMTAMVFNALRNENIIVSDGSQLMERLHVEDAAEAVIKVLLDSKIKFRPVYNLGFGNSYKLKNIAEKISEIVADVTGKEKVNIIVQPTSNSAPSFGMSSDLFFTDFNWKPKHTLNSIIESLTHYLINKTNA
jgi:nucleoside-diphosphate-sugar epimerase